MVEVCAAGRQERVDVEGHDVLRPVIRENFAHDRHVFAGIGLAGDGRVQLKDPQ